MNLNPFEGTKNEYSISEMYQKNKYDDLVENEELKIYHWDGYTYLLKSINSKINWTINSGKNDYQGEQFLFGEYEGKFYFVTTGYGSCSGCDVYQACRDLNDLEELRERLKRNIQEFDTLGEFADWANNHACGKFWWQEYDYKEFVRQFKEKYGVVLKSKRSNGK